MASDRLLARLAELEALSPSYARLATQLSDNVVRLEERLAQLDGKTEVYVVESGQDEDDPEAFTLRFSRRSPLGWGLDVFTPHLEWKPLSEASIDEKIRASKLFEALVEKMLLIIKDRLQGLNESPLSLPCPISDSISSRKEGA